MNRLKEAMMLLIANDKPLPPNTWIMNCPVNGMASENAYWRDFLLIYELKVDGTIIFIRWARIPAFRLNVRLQSSG